MSEVPPGELCSEAVGRDSCFGPSDREVEHFVKAALAMARRTSSRNESDWQRTFVHPPFNSELVIHHEHGGRERFRLKSLLAKGGMGMVYRAIDDRFGRTLAVKLIHPEQRTNSQFLGRFFREAILQARLQHPGIPAVYAYGIDPELGPFLAMKLVEGRTLSEILQDHFASPRSGLDPLLELLRQVAETLAYCHDRGVIHRDVKPSNIMVGTYGEVYLMDWGLAKSSGSDSDVVNEPTEPAPRQSSSLQIDERDETGSQAAPRWLQGEPLEPVTTPSMRLGTPGFAAPEQVQGNAAQVDARADVYSLGVILFRMLTGMIPDNQTMIHLILQFHPGDAELIGFTQRCLAVHPHDRLQNAGVVAAWLSEYRRQTSERLRRAELEAVEAKQRAVAERQQRRFLVGLVALAAVIGLGATLAGSERANWMRRLDEAWLRAEREAQQAAAQTDPRHIGEVWRHAVEVAERAEEDAARVSSWWFAGQRVDRIRERAAASRAARDLFNEVESIALRPYETIPADEIGVLSNYWDFFKRRGWSFAGPNQADPGPIPVSLADEQRPIWVIALNDWLGWLGSVPEHRDLAQRVRATTDQLDPDPVRILIRAALLNRDAGALDGLISFLSSPEPSPPSWVESPTTVVLLLQTLLSMDDDRSASLGVVALARMPDAIQLVLASQRIRHSDNRQMGSPVALALRPDSLSVQLNHAGSLLAHQRFNDVEAFSRAILERHPKESRGWLMLAQAIEGRGRVTEALDAARAAVECDGDSWGARYTLARLQLQAGDPETARRTLDRIEERLEGRPEMMDVQLIRLAELLRRLGDPERAVALCRRVLESHSDHALGFTSLGMALAQLGRIDEAEASWRHALALNPNEPRASGQLALLRFRQGRLGEAIELFERAFTNAASSQDIPLEETAAYLYNLRMAQARAGRFGDAETSLLRLSTFKPPHPKVRSALLEVLANDDDLNRAIHVTRGLMKNQPHDPSLRLTLAVLLMRSQQTAEAVDLAAQVQADHPDWFEPALVYGDLLGTVGRFAEAAQMLECALKLIGEREGPRQSPRNQRQLMGVIEHARQLETACRWVEVWSRGELCGFDPQHNPEFSMLMIQAALARGWIVPALTLAQRLNDADQLTPTLNLLDSDQETRLGLALAALKLVEMGEQSWVGISWRIQIEAFEKVATSLRQPATLRGWARSWLEPLATTARASIRSQLWGLPGLAPVRDPKRLQQLPATEREAWSAFWTRLDSQKSIE